MKDRAKALADLGSKLRSIRQEKGLSLEDVTEVTKIRTNFIEDIENGVFDNFPGGVYVRGFIKSYLSVLDADDLWAEYKPYIFTEEVVGAPDLILGTCTPPAKGFKPASRLWMIVVLLMIIAGFGWYGFSIWTNRDHAYDNAAVSSPSEEDIASVEEKVSDPSVNEETETVAAVSDDAGNVEKAEAILSSESVSSEDVVEGVTSVDVAATAVTATPVEEPLSAVPEKTEPVRNILVISTTRDCWVKLSGKENTIFQGIIKGNTTKEFEILEKTEVVYGRPASVKISFAGQDLGQPGKGGTVARWFYGVDGTSGRIAD
jgi:cytoskeletal protein RodZ